VAAGVLLLGVLVLIGVGLRGCLRGGRPALAFYAIMGCAAGNVGLLAASGALR
jgi:hypothetical protein